MKEKNLGLHSNDFKGGKAFLKRMRELRRKGIKAIMLNQNREDFCKIKTQIKENNV